MDILEGPYYKYSRHFLSLFGLWPYQDPRTKLISRVVTFLAVLTVLIPHIIRAYEVRHDFHLFLLCVPSLLYYMHYLTQFFHLSLWESQFKSLLEDVKNDFAYFKDENLRILREYSREAQKFNAIYAYYFCVGVMTFNGTTFIPHLQDLMSPLNESRPRHVTRHVKYNISKIDESFYFILLHGFVFDVVAIFIIIGFDTLLINYAQHACALFQITVHQLQNCTKQDRNNSSLRARQSQYYRNIVKAVVAHKHAIDFVDKIESLYSMVNFLVLGISLATITLTEFQSVAHKGSLDITCRYAFFTTGQLLNILYQNWPGQIVRDHSLRVHKYCYECDWCNEGMSDKNRKLLVFMMLRSQCPSLLSAGKIFILDLQNYLKILKASLSYFAVLTSIQKV